MRIPYKHTHKHTHIRIYIHTHIYTHAFIHRDIFIHSIFIYNKNIVNYSSRSSSVSIKKFNRYVKHFHEQTQGRQLHSPLKKVLLLDIINLRMEPSKAFYILAISPQIYCTRSSSPWRGVRSLRPPEVPRPSGSSTLLL